MSDEPVFKDGDLVIEGVIIPEVPEPKGGWKIPNTKPVIVGPFRALSDKEIAERFKK